MDHDATYYSELQGLHAMPGSINTVVSMQYHLRRPPSLSESCAWTPENVERTVLQHNRSGNVVSLKGVQVIPEHSIHPPILAEHRRTCETITIQILLRFLFHITLISIFETVFFFVYVSSLEDGGIIKTVDVFINNAVSACVTLSPEEKNIVNYVLSQYINVTQVVSTADAVYGQRQLANRATSNQAWIYVGGLGSLFLVFAAYGYIRKIKVAWTSLFCENMGLVLMLAAYEYMFFSTIITPYNPISGEEIERNAILTLNAQCGIF